MTIHRVHTAIVAMDTRNERSARFITIPPGSLISIQNEVKLFGLLEIAYCGERFEVFTRDVREHAQQLSRKLSNRSEAQPEAMQRAAC